MGTCLAIIVFFGAIFVLNGRNKATEARADTETAYEGKMIDKTPKDMEEEVQAFETETETEARWEVNGNSIIEVLLPDWKNKSKNTKEQSVSMCKIFIPVRGWK